MAEKVKEEEEVYLTCMKLRNDKGVWGIGAETVPSDHKKHSWEHLINAGIVIPKKELVKRQKGKTDAR